MSTINVGPFHVADRTREELLDQLVQLAVARRSSRAVCLHVNSLVHLESMSYVDAVNAANLAFADGLSIERLARLAGANQIERAPVTHVGSELLSRLRTALDRDVRVALVGAAPGVASVAGDVLARPGGVAIVMTEHGFHEVWEPVLAALRRLDPDIVFVGMGIPTEAEWVHRHASRLPPALHVTVGGWFDKLAGVEQPAPDWFVEHGLEWLWRAIRYPRRMLTRYLHGAIATVRVARDIRSQGGHRQ